MKKYSTLNLFIRSCLFSLFMITTTFFYSFICLAAWLLPLRYRYALVMSWNRLNLWALKIICHIRYTIKGLENVPADRNGIILSKHQSAWETLFLPTHFFEPAIIIKRELLWIPFFGWGLATLQPIAINRNQKSSAMAQILQQGKQYLDRGRWVLVFPEGTRIAPGKVGNYRTGGARLAVHTGYPILPIAHNAGYFWSKRQFIKQPGTIQVVLGPLIETKNRKPEEVLAEAKAWIEETVTGLSI